MKLLGRQEIDVIFVLHSTKTHTWELKQYNLLSELDNGE